MILLLVLKSGFGENLAELIDDDKLDLLGGELYEHFLADKESRSEWEDTYIKGLDQLGLTVDDRTETLARCLWCFSSNVI